jgi:hypothetical protein
MRRCDAGIPSDGERSCYRSGPAEPSVTTSYSYASILRDAQKARWSLDDVSACLHQIDFARRFLPDTLVHVDALDFLDDDGRRHLNQIRAHSYVRTFALVERFILPFVMMHAADSMHGSSEQLLALMQFGEEEAKHIALFERFSEAFEFGFGSACRTIGPPQEIAESVLAEDPLSVALAVLHIEWMTQDHYLRSVRNAEDIDPEYKNLLRFHWVEEAQHARLDTLLIDSAVKECSSGRRRLALDGYVRIVESLATALRDQVELDMEGFVSAGGSLTDAQRDRWRTSQATAYQEAFLRAGIVHPRFRAVVERNFDPHGEVLDALAARYVFVPHRS